MNRPSFISDMATPRAEMGFIYTIGRGDWPWQGGNRCTFLGDTPATNVSGAKETKKRNPLLQLRRSGHDWVCNGVLLIAGYGPGHSVMPWIGDITRQAGLEMFGFGLLAGDFDLGPSWTTR